MSKLRRLAGRESNVGVNARLCLTLEKVDQSRGEGGVGEVSDDSFINCKMMKYCKSEKYISLCIEVKRW